MFTTSLDLNNIPFSLGLRDCGLEESFDVKISHRCNLISNPVAQSWSGYLFFFLFFFVCFVVVVCLFLYVTSIEVFV